MATLKDVAKKAGVSTATVSYVLNGRLDKVGPEVTKRVQEVMKELGYQPNMMARALRSRKRNIIGVLSEDVTTFQVSSILKGINQAADEMKYQIILGDLALSDKIWNGRIQDYSQVISYQEEIQEKLNIFRAAGVSGVIYVGMHNRDVSGLLNTDMPLVYAYCYTKEEEDITVDCDNQVISCQLVEKMLHKGHRRIGLISGPVDSIPTYRRMMGYQEALMQSGITFDPSLIAYGNWSDGSGYTACMELLALENPPTAIYCMNDWMALGAMKALKEKNIAVPRQVEIAGFDDIDLCGFVEPPLTSVELPMTEIGREAAQIVVDLIHGKKVDDRHRELSCCLKERESFQSRKEEN